MLSADQIFALATAVAAARKCEQATGCPSALTVAQWAEESEWGKKSPGNNCFGIKSYTGCYGIQELTTKEFVGGKKEVVQRMFATFPSEEACFERHAELITKGHDYELAWSRYLIFQDIGLLIDDIAPIYASDPEYASNLKDVLKMQAVQAMLAKEQ